MALVVPTGWIYDDGPARYHLLLKDPTHKEQGRGKREIFTQPKKEEVVLLSVVVVSKY